MPHLLLNTLNHKQQKAVQTVNGPILILAGAGSGKTMTLTHKVAYLILEKNIPAENILMLTFTNKAANEMKERIEVLLKKSKGGWRVERARPEQAHREGDPRRVTAESNAGENTGQERSKAGPADSRATPFAGTFHSLCAQILRKNGGAIGISPSFGIYDDVDQKDAIKQVMIELDISQKNFHPNAIRATISQAKNELIASTDYPQFARGHFQETVALIYQHYQKLLRKNQALDFDDLIMETVRLFREEAGTLKAYQEQFQYVLVDEYQDTNHAQYVLTRQLSGGTGNICIVGDASQSIYSWRGADFRNIVRFKKDYPDVIVFNLEQNYRSTQNILDAAFSVISKNSTHPILKLWTDKASGAKIDLYEARNEQDEARFIISRLQELDAGLSDSAILYRTNAQSRVIEEALLHEAVPYILVGGVRFYGRKEIKDALSYMRLLTNPKDSVARKRAEKLGKRRLEKFLAFVKEMKKKNLDEIPTLELLDQSLAASSYLERFDRENEEDLTRLENIKELRSVAAEFPNIFAFLENVALVEAESKAIGTGNSNGHVTLMTLHAAKGLEFTNVFLVGMEEGLFPHSRSLLDVNELEEERRLCYVGITRARQKLHVSFARHRLYFGSRTSNMISRFVRDIPKELTDFQEPIF